MAPFATNHDVTRIGASAPVCFSVNFAHRNRKQFVEIVSDSDGLISIHIEIEREERVKRKGKGKREKGKGKGRGKEKEKGEERKDEKRT